MWCAAMVLWKLRIASITEDGKATGHFRLQGMRSSDFPEPGASCGGSFCLPALPARSEPGGGDAILRSRIGGAKG